jgi:antirestriction protein ArdC
MAKVTYSPEERKARLESAHAELTAAVQAISTSDDWRAFLDFARKLHSYSAQNRMWLFQQAMMRGWDDLGQVAGFRAWLTLGRYVRKGEHGLSVLAPVRVKTTAEDGSESWVVRGFKVEHVFAARQTDGEGAVPAPIRPKLLTGEGPAGAWVALCELVAARGFTVERTDLYPANGQTSFTTKVVTVADRLDEAAAVKTLGHELAHVLLHQPSQIDYHTKRERCEVEAESIAFVVCAELGLATAVYSFPYVASWAAGDTKVVTAAADKVLACAGEIIAALEQAGAPVAA